MLDTGLLPRRWLITGGCGFIGRNLVRRLLKESGLHLRLVDNLAVGSMRDLLSVAPNCRERERDELRDSSGVWANQVELVVGDVLDAELALDVAVGADVIVHLAANTGVQPSVENPRADCMTNVVGTLNYLEAARITKVSRFVFASSGAPIGECNPPIHEELAPHPVSPYGASKLAGEGYCSAYFRTFGVETVALRFGNVYGPYSGHKSSVVAKFIRHAMHGERLEIYGDGRQTRDFIYVEDLLAAILAAATVARVGGESFQIATASETTVSELVDLLGPVLLEHGVARPEISYSHARAGDVSRNYSDTTKAQKMLGWRATTSLEEGLRATSAWFLEQQAGTSKPLGDNP